MKGVLITFRLMVCPSMVRALQNGQKHTSLKFVQQKGKQFALFSLCFFYFNQAFLSEMTQHFYSLVGYAVHRTATEQNERVFIR